MGVMPLLKFKQRNIPIIRRHQQSGSENVIGGVYQMEIDSLTQIIFMG
jgi:hypothetical protein